MYTGVNMYQMNNCMAIYLIQMPQSGFTAWNLQVTAVEPRRMEGDIQSVKKDRDVDGCFSFCLYDVIINP